MSVKTTDNTANVLNDVRAKTSAALRAMLDDIDRTARPVTPKRFGDLSQRVRKQVLGLRATIAWMTPYGVYQEEKQFENYTTPGTGPHFARNSVRQVVNRAAGHFKKAGL